MIKVLIADDHPIVRAGIKQIFDEIDDIRVAGEVENGNQVLEKVRCNQYDVVLLDISMPRLNGIEVLKILRREFPKVHVLILSMHPEEVYAVRSLKAGAAGYLTKGSAPTELISAIRKVSRGGKYVTAEVAERLAFNINSFDRDHPHEALSDREYQVMRLIACGKTVMEIAEELYLSDRTISTYRYRILEKMGMKKNVEIIHYAIKNNLVE